MPNNEVKELEEKVKKQYDALWDDDRNYKNFELQQNHYGGEMDFEKFLENNRNTADAYEKYKEDKEELERRRRLAKDPSAPEFIPEKDVPAEADIPEFKLTPSKPMTPKFPKSKPKEKKLADTKPKANKPQDPRQFELPGLKPDDVAKDLAGAKLAQAALREAAKSRLGKKALGKMAGKAMSPALQLMMLIAGPGAEKMLRDYEDKKTPGLFRKDGSIKPPA